MFSRRPCGTIRSPRRQVPIEHWRVPSGMESGSHGANSLRPPDVKKRSWNKDVDGTIRCSVGALLANSMVNRKLKTSAEPSDVQSAPLRDHQKSTQAGSNRTLASPFWDGVGVPRGEFLATIRCQEEELEQKDVGGTIRCSVGAPLTNSMVNRKPEVSCLHDLRPNTSLGLPRDRHR